MPVMKLALGGLTSDLSLPERPLPTPTPWDQSWSLASWS